MQKINVVLVLLNAKEIKTALRTLNFAAANLVAIVVENGDGNFFNIGNKKIPFVSFASMKPLLNRGADFVWLLSGVARSVADFWRIKKFLMASGVPDDNIVNFYVQSHISTEWLGNLKYVEKFGADFFATGISYTEVGLDLNYIPHVRGRGVNLSGSNQDLLQGYLTAKHVFAHVPPGTVKFVIIGLAPYSFRYDNAKAFAVISRHLQYMLAIGAPERNLHDTLLKILISDAVKKIFRDANADYTDFNFDLMKNNMNKQIPAEAVVDWEAELKNLTKKFYPDTVEKNFRVMEDYIQLCLANGAKPVGVVFPFAPIIHDKYDAELLKNFRALIRRLEKNYPDFAFVDLFDLPLGYDCFYNMAHLNLRGSAAASTILGLRLRKKNILPAENFCAATYDYFNKLSNMLTPDDYNELLAGVFKFSVRKLRQKSKLTVGFVLYDASMWCGDDLYNLFAADGRFEPTIFLCLRHDVDDEIIREDFWRGVEQFKSRGLNVVALPEKNSPVPAQDVLIFLTPYFHVLPDAFQTKNVTARTLMTYIPYDFGISRLNLSHMELLRTAWKMFFQSPANIKMYDEFSSLGMPRGIFSGYPKMDVFFNRKDFTFDWKMTRPDAKKIIWAPHWSINNGVNYATFQWNFKFMYEFAAAHPEISWVVKPHPNLLFSAVRAGVFPDDAAFNAYLNAWNNLPNAKVVTGGYYQAIFATSDGMIHDSGSFIAEYQFTHKPMIFLTRDTQEFNELGNGILNVSYRVDGRDLDGIAALMQKVFVEGNDPLKSAREKFFDDNLNYVKQNGTTASEFIFRAIAGELEEGSA